MPYYPSDMPDGCPPSDALPANGRVVFRVVRNDPPQAGDFRTPHELGLYLGKDECKRRSLSVTETELGARKLMKLFKKLGTKVAKGTLNFHDGRIKQTPGTVPDHVSWWPCIACVRHAPFSVI